HKRVGTDYNWTTYFYLAAYRLHLPVTTALLKRRVSRSDKLICSQAVDDIYRTAGVHLFNDGRLPYDVTPGDLARLIPECVCRIWTTTSKPHDYSCLTVSSSCSPTHPGWACR